MSVFMSINHQARNVTVAAHKVQRAEGDVVRFDLSVDHAQWSAGNGVKWNALAEVFEEVFGVNYHDASLLAAVMERLAANSKRDHDFGELSWVQAVEVALAVSEMVEAGDRALVAMAQGRS